MQVSSLSVVHRLHSDGVSHEFRVVDGRTGGAAICVRVSQRHRQALLYRQQHRQGEPSLIAFYTYLLTVAAEPWGESWTWVHFSRPNPIQSMDGSNPCPTLHRAHVTPIDVGMHGV